MGPLGPIIRIGPPIMQFGPIPLPGIMGLIPGPIQGPILGLGLIELGPMELRPIELGPIHMEAKDEGGSWDGDRVPPIDEGELEMGILR